MAEKYAREQGRRAPEQLHFDDWKTTVGPAGLLYRGLLELERGFAAWRRASVRVARPAWTLFCLCSIRLWLLGS